MPFRSLSPVRKAVDPAGRTTRTLTAQERKIVEAFLQAAGALESSVDSTLIQQLISQGSASALGGLDTGGFIAALEPMVQAIQQQVVAGGELGIDGLPTSIQGAYRFDALDPRAIAWAQTRAGELIVQITDEQRAVLNRVLARSIENGWTVQQTTQDLRQVIGLHDRWATAVQSAWDREYARLLGTGMSETLARQQADALGSRYRQRLLRARAENIARTEILTAANQGRWLSWAQGVEGGYISDTATKRWTTGPLVTRSPSRRQVCDICAGIRGEERPWNQPFSNGRMMPPAHPSCRCAAELVPLSIEDIRQRLRDTEPEPAPAATDDLAGLRSRIDADRARARKLADEANPNLGLVESNGSTFRPTAQGKELNDTLIRVGREVREEAERRAGTQLASLRDEVKAARAAADEATRLQGIEWEASRKVEKDVLDRIALEKHGKRYGELGLSDQFEVRQLMRVDPDYELAAAKMREANRVLAEARDRFSDAQRALGIAERQNLLDVMGELRAIGTGDDLKFATKAKSGNNLQAQTAIREVAEVFPEDWVTTVAEKRVLQSKASTTRGFARDLGSRAEITVTPGPSTVSANRFYRCAVHEMTHIMEYTNARLKIAQHSFYWQRTTGEQLVKIYKNEYGRKDAWYDLYVGKEYGGAKARSNYEVLTMGMENLFGGSKGKVVMDQEYRDWLIGVWLSL